LKGVILGYSFLNKLSTAKLLREIQNQKQLISRDELVVQRLCPFMNVPGVAGSLAIGQMLFENLPQRLHLRCLGCSKTIAIIDETFAEVTESLGLEYNFEVVSGNLEIFGFCPDCRDKKQ
jgi:Fe2+ or Zn2+ uptake regulation protein